MTSDRRLITVLVDGVLLEMREILVARGLTNALAPLTCQSGHQHKPGDIIWTRADRDHRPEKRVLWCDECAVAGRVKDNDNTAAQR